MDVKEETPEWVKQVLENKKALEMDRYINYDCPICGSPNDEYTTCGCYADVHYGKD